MSQTTRHDCAQIELPPLLTAIAAAAGEEPFAFAVRAAASGEAGAGDCVCAATPERAALAVILEPDRDFAACRQVLPLMFNALADSLGVLLPPKSAVQLRWPATLLLNGAEVGRLGFAVPGEPRNETVPDWLVIGFALRLAHAADITAEPGHTSHVTALYEEGGGEITAERLIASVAAHFLSWLDLWQSDGFRPVHTSLIGRIEGHGEKSSIHDAANIWHAAEALAVSDDTELLIRTAENETRAVAVDWAGLSAAAQEGSAPK